MPKTRNDPNQDDAPTRIINATLALIGEKGSDALRTREILERAQVSNQSAISYYFGSLENLRLRALERYFAGAQTVFAGMEDEADPRQALLGYCRRMARFVLDNPSLERNLVFLVMSGGEASAIFARILGPNIQALQGVIGRGRKAQGLDPNPERDLFDAISLASATIYPLLLAPYGPGTLGLDPLDEAQRERYFINLVNRVLGGDNG